MRRTNWQASIHCPIGLLTEQAEHIVHLTQEINRARTAGEKAPVARVLLETVDLLLACGCYDAESLSCYLCRNFSGLQRKTAALVVEAARLSHRRSASEAPRRG